LLAFPVESEKAMSEAPNYEAVLADIDARIAKLQATREGIVMILSQGGSPVTPIGGGGGGSQTTVERGAFHGKSISEATKSFLQMTKQKQNTQTIIEALETGGLPRYKYATVYAVLRRREEKVGDIVNENGDWRLKEWAPHYKKATPKAEESGAEPDGEQKAEKKSA
jgi:hypothetical protein